MTIVARAAALLVLAPTLAGCEHVLSRRDGIAPGGGDAVAWNRAVHTIDPWPAASADTTIPVSGRRVAAAIERYETLIPGEAEKAAPAATITLAQ